MGILTGMVFHEFKIIAPVASFQEVCCTWFVLQNPDVAAPHGRREPGQDELLVRGSLVSWTLIKYTQLQCPLLTMNKVLCQAGKESNSLASLIPQCLRHYIIHTLKKESYKLQQNGSFLLPEYPGQEHKPTSSASWHHPGARQTCRTTTSYDVSRCLKTWYDNWVTIASCRAKL